MSRPRLTAQDKAMRARVRAMLEELEEMETEDSWLMESRLEIKAAMLRLLWGEAKCKRVALAAFRSMAERGFNPIRPEHHVGAFLTALATDGSRRRAVTS